MMKICLKSTGIIFVLLIILMPSGVSAGGVSPYLPLNMSPEIERQIERVLILAGRPVMTRPIAVATVLEALYDARQRDEELCGQVEMYLMRYMNNAGLTRLRAEASVSAGDSDQIIPNQHGKDADSSWEVSGEVFYRLGEYALINLGGIAYDGRTTPTGSMLSLGIDYAQLDIGYRDHWLSPFTDSSMLISTEAPTMPSITLSNYRPITGLGLSYEVFLTEMSESDQIAYQDGHTTGKPRLAGVHLQVEPVAGYAFSANRNLQFGGGARPDDSFSDLIDAFVKPYENEIRSLYTEDKEFGNQQASLTSRVVFPGKHPFAVYFEFAGEDFSQREDIHLGSVSFSMGADFPRLWDRIDLTYENTEWQNAWYTHHVYGDGMTNDGVVIGHWFGDQRQFNDGSGGMSHMLRLGWQIKDDGYLQARYRTLKVDSYTSILYERMQELGINYSWPWHSQTMGLGLYSGRDVFGDSYARLSVSMDFTQGWWQDTVGSISTASDTEDETDFLMDTGVNYSRFDSTVRNADRKYLYRDSKNSNVHLGIGALHAVSEHGDLGVRFEWDRIEGYNLYSMRMMDYRYRIGTHFAVSGFFGVGRFELETPAYGYYIGAGFQGLNIIPKWDLCVDIRKNQEMSRWRLRASDSRRRRVFYNVEGVAVYLSRRF